MSNAISPLGFVVGAGSIGRRHALSLARRCERLIVVDPSAEARHWVQSKVAVPVLTTSTLGSALEGVGADVASAVAVIANWGPDHAGTFHALADAGFRRILCEKPMAHSPIEAWSMARRAREDDLRLTFGMYLRYAGLPEFVAHHLQECAGGPPIMLAVHGGAQCLVTNGIHFLDLACALFGETPRSVWAEAVDGRINPRSPDLGFWEGTAVWAFSAGRSATVTLSNGSSVSSAMHVYGPNGRIDLSSPSSLDGPVSVAARDRREIERDPRVTRVGDLTRQMTYGRGFEPQRDPTEQQLDELIGASPISYPPERAAAVMEALLATLASAEEGRRIKLPLSPDDPLYGRTWPVS